MLGRRRTDSTADADIHGFLGEGNVLAGELNLRGGFRVDGKITGKISSPSVVIVGPSGVIEAEEMRVVALSVSGIVRGNIEVQERLEIHEGGKVYGRVRIARAGLVVAPGALLEATLVMEAVETAPAQTDPSTPQTQRLGEVWDEPVTALEHR